MNDEWFTIIVYGYDIVSDC